MTEAVLKGTQIKEVLGLRKVVTIPTTLIDYKNDIVISIRPVKEGIRNGATSWYYVKIDHIVEFGMREQ